MGARPHAEPVADRPDWIEGSFRFDSYEDAVPELLALGADVEVLLPVGMRDAMADAARTIVRRHASRET